MIIKVMFYICILLFVRKFFEFNDYLLIKVNFNIKVKGFLVIFIIK